MFQRFKSARDRAIQEEKARESLQAEKFWGRNISNLKPEDYEIAYFVSSDTEAQAALDLLDERYGRVSPDQLTSYSAIVVAGRMCGRDVVVVKGSWEREDNLESEQVYLSHPASQIKVIFPNLLVGFVVGTITQVPDLTQTLSQDIRLGDVPIGLLEGEEIESIVYGLTRETSGELHTPDTNHKRGIANSAVQAAIHEIELEAPNKTHKFFHYYGALKTREYESGKYADPGQNADILYRINMDGIEEPVDRAPRPNRQRTRVWHGPIDPGKYLTTKDTRFWGRFNQAHNMESLLPVYAIRGICNYGDGHKNKNWQPYASAIATAYAKTVLDKISGHDSETVTAATSAFERSDSEQVSRLRPRPIQHQTSKPNLTHTPLHNATTEVTSEELASELPQSAAKWSFLFPMFHRSTLIAVVLLFSLLGGVMMTFAVNQTREPVCNPTRDTISKDDGFWTMLSQLSFLILTVYCTLYPVILRSTRREAFIDNFWFFGLLLTSFLTNLAAIIIYLHSWRIATILGCVSSLAQVISIAQLAISLDPTTDNQYLPRRGTWELGELRTR